MTNLSTMNIMAAADALLSKMNELGIMERCSLSFTVGAEDFNKIDEDLYYRLREDDTKDEYVPSEESVRIEYGSIDITINRYAEEEEGRTR